MTTTRKVRQYWKQYIVVKETVIANISDEATKPGESVLRKVKIARKPLIINILPYIIIIFSIMNAHYKTFILSSSSSLELAATFWLFLVVSCHLFAKSICLQDELLHWQPRWQPTRRRYWIDFWNVAERTSWCVPRDMNNKNSIKKLLNGWHWNIICDD